jgi:hypothetical protein
MLTRNVDRRAITPRTDVSVTASCVAFVVHIGQRSFLAMRTTIIRTTITLSLALSFLASLASGQTLTIGTNYTTSPNSSDSNAGPTRTDIDLTNPATATGSVTTVKFYWSQAGCSNAVKIKFFRRSGSSLTLTAERGPLTPSFNDSTVTLSPAVPVLQGDLIGIARVAACGNPATFFGTPSAGYLQYASDVTGTVDFAAGVFSSSQLLLYGFGVATESVARVIPAVASTAGSFGSNFKTAVQLFNPAATGPNLTGNLVFHPAGASGSPGDPLLPYSLAPGALLYISDVVAAVGRSGLGSIDIIVPAGQSAPLAVTRVYNDGGALGTSGFTEELIDPTTSNRVLTTGTSGFILTPPDISKARLNIGVRSLASGAMLTARLKDSTGTVLATVTKMYQPNWFEQTTSDLFFGVAVGSNQVVQISVSNGSAIIYGSTNDNITSDPSVQFMTIVPPVM